MSLKFTDYDIVFSEIPDEVSLAISLSRCPNRCEGCHSPQLQTDIGEPLTFEVLDLLIERYRSAITCILFLGGDADLPDLFRSAEHVKIHFPELKRAWYSGRSVMPNCGAQHLWNYVKLGPYISSLGPLKSPTTNQKLYSIAADGTLIDLTSRFWRKGF